MKPEIPGSSAPTSGSSIPTTRNVGIALGPAAEGLPFPLWGNVALIVYPESRGTYPIEFRRGDTQLCIETPKSPPWLSTRLQDRLVSALASALGDEARPRDFMRRKIGETFSEIENRLENDEGAKRALTPGPVRRIMEETDSVVVFPSEATFYEVTLNGRTLTIPSVEMARTDPGFINAAILNAFPLDPLDASKDDWKAIKAYWLSPDIAEIREVEEATEAEVVIDRLRMHLESVTIVGDATQIIGDHLAWYDRERDRIWVLNTRIARFITEDLKKPDSYSSALSKILRTAGVMAAPSVKMRGVGRFTKAVRCWGFQPAFLGFKGLEEAPSSIQDIIGIPTGGSK